MAKSSRRTNKTNSMDNTGSDSSVISAAIEPGEYQDFTGYICHWDGMVEGYVEYAWFDLAENNGVNMATMHWHDGIWISGHCHGACWSGGIWKSGTFSEGNWYGGDWIDGTFDCSVWMDGTWGRGVFDCSQWRNGVWADGVFRESTWLNGRWLEGQWENSIWIDEQSVCHKMDQSRWRHIRLEKHFY